jgi:nicotinamidase-related amidase
MTALILIDLQKAIDHPSWGVRDHNPNAEANAVRLLAAWRARAWPIFHVRHDSRFPGSTYCPGQPGNDFKPETAPLPAETIVPKQTCSAFVGTDLEKLIAAAGCRALVICGVITNNSIEATVRSAGDLGFEVRLAEDACFTFGRNDWNGNWRTAAEVHALSLANLHKEYCQVATTDEILG